MIIISLRKIRCSDGTFAITVFRDTGCIETDIQFDASAATLSPRKLCKTRTLQGT